MYRIKQLRTELGWSQGKLSAKLGINSQQLMSSYERGETEPSIELWIKMSELFDADIEYIAGQSDIRHKKNESSTLSLKQDIFMAAYDSDEIDEADKELLLNMYNNMIKNKKKKE